MWGGAPSGGPGGEQVAWEGGMGEGGYQQREIIGWDKRARAGNWGVKRKDVEAMTGECTRSWGNQEV